MEVVKMKKALLITVLSIAVVSAGYGLASAHGGNGNFQRGTGYGHMGSGYGHMAPGNGHVMSWLVNVGSGFQHMMDRFGGSSDTYRNTERYEDRNFRHMDTVNERPHRSFR